MHAEKGLSLAMIKDGSKNFKFWEYYTCIYIYIYIHTSVITNVCMYVCVCVCVHVCTHMCYVTEGGKQWEDLHQ